MDFSEQKMHEVTLKTNF